MTKSITIDFVARRLIKFLSNKWVNEHGPFDWEELCPLAEQHNFAWYGSEFDLYIKECRHPYAKREFCHWCRHLSEVASNDECPCYFHGSFSKAREIALKNCMEVLNAN